jgi:hypothetical protein
VPANQTKTAAVAVIVVARAQPWQMMPRTVVCCIQAIRTGCEHCRATIPIAIAIAIAIAAAGSGPFVWSGVTL